jgi:hypothetical protein
MARYMVHTATGANRKTLYGKTRGEIPEKLTKAMANRRPRVGRAQRLGN